MLHVTLLGGGDMATMHVNERVQKYRVALRASGLRPVQIWVPDTRRPDFVQECQRQSRLVFESDQSDSAILEFMDETLRSLDGWKE